MQEIIVKEVRGPLGKGEKKFFAVVDEKGGEYTTFDTKIKAVNPGSKLGLEIKVEGKYINIVEWKVLVEAPASGGNGSKEQWGYKRDLEGIRVEYELKAQLQQIERLSIEAQTAYNGIIELGKIIIADTTKKEVTTYQQIIKKALAWAESRLDASISQKPVKLSEKPAPVSATKKAEKKADITTGSGQKIDPEHPFPHIGALLKWCTDRGVDRPKFMEIVGVKEKDLPNVNLIEAHELVTEYIKEHTEELKDPDDCQHG